MAFLSIVGLVHWVLHFNCKLGGFYKFSIVRIQGLQTTGVDIIQAIQRGMDDLDVEFAKFYK
ncbi:hypothetical protein [Companilactobacillus jidongensis]|uniref:hypothetical protein n=1 Tax=Companilactobacillus jidongensis TaxID=2486006 RepID=UPI000F7B0A5A|nr:hypothetical protein [Companilactobacillus jidongensis]